MKIGGNRFSVALLRPLAIALLLSGTIAAYAQPAAAQDTNPGLVSDTKYQSPQFDFSLTWDDPWQVSDGSVASEDGQYDQIDIESNGAFAEFILVDGTDTPQSYMDILTKNVEESGKDYKEIATDSGDGYISTTAEVTLTSQGSDLEVREYIEVGEIDGGGIFTGRFVSSTTDFADEWASFNDSVQRDGNDAVFLGTPDGIKSSNTPDDEPTNTPDDEPTSTSNDNGSGDSGIDGNSFTGPNYGYSVTWDDATWEAKDSSTSTDDTLVLTSDTAQLQIRSYSETDATVRTCVTAAADETKASDGVSDFTRAASKIEAPEAGEGSFSRLYTLTYTGSNGDTIDFVNYIECRPLTDGAFLLITLLVTTDNLPDVLPDYQDVVDSIELAGDNSSSGDNGNGDNTDDVFGKIGKQSGDDETPTAEAEPTDEPTDEPTHEATEPKLTSSKYTGGAFDWSVTWDKAVWTAEALETADGYEGVKLTSDNSSVWVEAFTGYGGDADTCLSTSADDLNTVDGVSDVAEGTKLDLPKTDSDASAGIYTYTYTSSSNNNSIDFVEYLDCRVLEKGSAVLRVTAITTADDYDTELDSWSEVLSGIEIGSGSTANTSGDDNSSSSTNLPPSNAGETGDDNNSSSSSNSSSNDEFPGVDGQTYTSPQFNYSLTWDKTWEVQSATDDKTNGSTLTLSNGTSTAILLGGGYPNDPADCVTAISGVRAKTDTFTNYAIATDSDGKDMSGASATSGYGIYQYTDGGDDYVDYIECRPSSTGDFTVVLIFNFPASAISTEQKTLQSLLDGLTIDG